MKPLLLVIYNIRIYLLTFTYLYFIYHDLEHFNIIDCTLIVFNKNKNRVLQIKKSFKKIEVEVVEYRKENGGMKNEQKSLNYPYVRIKTEKNEYSIVKLQFANNFKKPFKIGEKIFVFLYLGDLLYWNAYDNGIYKYLPESWKITK